METKEIEISETDDFVNLKFDDAEHMTMFKDLCKKHHMRYMSHRLSVVVTRDNYFTLNSLYYENDQKAIDPVLEKMGSDSKEMTKKIINLTFKNPFDSYLFDKLCECEIEDNIEDNPIKLVKEIKCKFELTGTKLQIQNIMDKWENLDRESLEYQLIDEHLDLIFD